MALTFGRRHESWAVFRVRLGNFVKTSCGDPVGFEALRKVFESRPDRREFCSLGSIKRNIGHLSNAEGYGINHFGNATGRSKSSKWSAKLDFGVGMGSLRFFLVSNRCQEWTQTPVQGSETVESSEERENCESLDSMRHRAKSLKGQSGDVAQFG